MFEKKPEVKGKRPDFTAREGVMVWKNIDRNGKEYLSVKIPIVNISVNCFALPDDTVEVEKIED